MARWRAATIHAFGREDGRRPHHATDRQRWYLRKLLSEAFAKRLTHGLCLDGHHLPENLGKAEASAAIDSLKALIERAGRAA